jgi:hypothetical protein
LEISQELDGPLWWRMELAYRDSGWQLAIRDCQSAYLFCAHKHQEKG